MIANFDEFNHYIDSLFTSGTVSDFANYRQALALSKNKRKAKIASISQQINELLKLIEQARINIKQASSDDKKSQGQALNAYIQIKQALVKQYAEAKNITLFSELTTDAKIYACTKSLLLKYLPNELDKIPYLSMPQDEQGNLIFVPDKIKDTPFDRDIHHIIDYVTSYLENYPEKVRGAKHFTGLHKKCTDMNELIEEIDAYFAKLNSPTEKETNRIKKSHSGLEIVMNMPEYGLQAVRLLTKPALQYEGSAMHHCVGSYATKVEKGETAIYSIRLTADENHEMIPVATMEYKDGKLTQIKGPHDKEISFTYLQGVRDFILYLTGKKNMTEIASDDTVKDKQNIGIIKDNTGVYRDIYTLIEDENYCFDNIYIEASSLPYIPTNHLTVKTLNIRGELKADNLKYLSAINVQSTIHFHELDFEGKHLDLSNFTNTNIILNFSKVPNLETITLSDKAESLKLSGEATELKNIIGAPHLHNLNLTGTYPLLSLAINNWPELIDLDTTCDNFTSPDVDLQNCSHLKNILICSSEKGNNCQSLILPDSVESLSLNGDFPHLNQIISSNLEQLNMGGSFESLTSLNFSQIYPKLKKLDMTDCKMANLRELIASSNILFINMNQSEFPALEKMDFSAMPLKTFGRIDSNLMGSITISTLPQSMRENIEVDNNNRVLNPLRLRGVVLQEANLPNLKEIKYPQDVEIIDFALNHFNPYDVVDFKAYPNLRTIETPDFKIINMSKPTQPDTTAILTRRQAVNY